MDRVHKQTVRYGVGAVEDHGVERKPKETLFGGIPAELLFREDGKRYENLPLI
jgi:hypothetical protein